MSDLSYEEALRALQDRGRFGIRLGLGRTRALLAELGDPQRTFRGALVAGTNGKGSVLALAGSALRAAGYRVAETPKPHLVSYRERLQVDGRLVDPATFARLVGEVLDAAARISRRSGPPTEFELLTAVAFRWFAESGDRPGRRRGRARRPARCDPRLGRRRRGDHQRRPRPHRPARRHGHGHRPGEGRDHRARRPGRDRRDRRRARGHPAPGAPARRAAHRGRHARVARLGPRRDRRRAGRARRDAGRPARPAPGGERGGRRCRARRARGGRDRDRLGRDPPARLRRGTLARSARAARDHGRDADGAVREVLLDGAHNPAGAAVLARALDDLRPTLQGGDEPDPAPVTLILATMADKDVAGVLAALASSPVARSAQVICTQVDLPRALPAASLAKGWAAVAPGSRPIVVRPVERRSSGHWRMRPGRSSSPGRSTSSGRCGASSSTIRSCATNPTTPRSSRRPGQRRSSRSDERPIGGAVGTRLDAGSVLARSGGASARSSWGSST